MTTAIVMNTRLAAVTEHTTTLQSMTQTHGASATDGLCTLGGDRDRTTRIDARWMGPLLLNGSLHKNRIPEVYFAMRGEGVVGEQGTLLVDANGTEYSYLFDVRAAGVSRGKPGKGICENYLAVGYANVAGRRFTIDRVEPTLTESKTRKAY